MKSERWFPAKYNLPDGTSLSSLLYVGLEWQIYQVNQENKILTIRKALAKRWILAGLLPEPVLLSFKFGEIEFYALASGRRQELAPVSECGSPDSKADAMLFALSLCETRKIEKEAPLHDAIYLERYSRLLPTWTVSSEVGDEMVLGTWLTGGVGVSATSFRRLSSLMGWLRKDDVREIVEAAGFSVPTGRGFPIIALDKQRDDQAREQKSDEKDQNLEGHAKHTLSDKGSLFRLSGRPALESFFNEHVIDIVLNDERYRSLGIDFPSAIVLHGPPGCGKTFAVERLVEYLDWPIFNIDSSSVGSPYIHETSRKVAEVFDKAMDSSPSVIVIDEMESFLSDRQSHLSSGLHHVEEVSEFLRRIPDATIKHVLVIGMTNRLEMIDSAILRRGRFDHVIEVGMPSKHEVKELFISLIQKLPTEGDLETNEIITALTERPLSDAAFVVREASRLAAKAQKKTIDQVSLEDALDSLPPRQQDGSERPIGFIKD